MKHLKRKKVSKERIDYIVNCIKTDSFIWDSIMSLSDTEFKELNKTLNKEIGKYINRIGEVVKYNPKPRIDNRYLQIKMREVYINSIKNE